MVPRSEKFLKSSPKGPQTPKRAQAGHRGAGSGGLGRRSPLAPGSHSCPGSPFLDFGGAPSEDACTAGTCDRCLASLPKRERRPPLPTSLGKRVRAVAHRPCALPGPGSSAPRFPSSAAGRRAGCPPRSGKWTFSSSHKSNPVILGPPPSLEMFIGDRVYSAVTARKRSDIITSDQSPLPAPRASWGPPLSPSHSRALLDPRASVVGLSFFLFFSLSLSQTLSYNLDY